MSRPKRKRDLQAHEIVKVEPSSSKKRKNTPQKPKIAKPDAQKISPLKKVRRKLSGLFKHYEAETRRFHKMSHPDNQMWIPAHGTNPWNYEDFATKDPAKKYESVFSKLLLQISKWQESIKDSSPTERKVRSKGRSGFSKDLDDFLMKIAQENQDIFFNENLLNQVDLYSFSLQIIKEEYDKITEYCDYLSLPLCFSEEGLNSVITILLTNISQRVEGANRLKGDAIEFSQDESFQEKLVNFRKNCQSFIEAVKDREPVSGEVEPSIRKFHFDASQYLSTGAEKELSNKEFFTVIRDFSPRTGVREMQKLIQDCKSRIRLLPLIIVKENSDKNDGVKQYVKQAFDIDEDSWSIEINDKVKQLDEEETEIFATKFYEEKILSLLKEYFDLEKTGNLKEAYDRELVISQSFLKSLEKKVESQKSNPENTVQGSTTEVAVDAKPSKRGVGLLPPPPTLNPSSSYPAVQSFNQGTGGENLLPKM